MKKESLAKQAVQKKPLGIKIFVRICVFLMAFSLIGVYIAYMIAPTPEENTDEVVDNEITNVIDENNNAENDNTTSEENLPSEENVDTNSEEL